MSLSVIDREDAINRAQNAVKDFYAYGIRPLHLLVGGKCHWFDWLDARHQCIVSMDSKGNVQDVKS